MKPETVGGYDMKKVLIASVTVAVLLLACGEEEDVTPADPPQIGRAHV